MFARRGTRARYDPMLRDMLLSGVVKAAVEDSNRAQAEQDA